jgi:hypothetical protein
MLYAFEGLIALNGAIATALLTRRAVLIYVFGCFDGPSVIDRRDDRDRWRTS